MRGSRRPSYGPPLQGACDVDDVEDVYTPRPYRLAPFGPNFGRGFAGDDDADPYDLTPETPYVRGASEAEAIFDVARVALKAAEEFPGAKPVALAWATQADEAEPNVAQKVADKISDAAWWWPPAIAYNMLDEDVTEPGNVVTLPGKEAEIASSMSDIYAEGAEDLDDAGAEEWADVLWAASDRSRGVQERSYDVSVKSAADEAVERGKTFTKVAAPVGVILGLVAAYLYITK